MTGKVTKYYDFARKLTINCIQIEHEVILKMDIFMLPHTPWTWSDIQNGYIYVTTHSE